MQEIFEGILGKILDECTNEMFSAEVYNDEFDGTTITNLICLGNVRGILERNIDELKKVPFEAFEKIKELLGERISEAIGWNQHKVNALRSAIEIVNQVAENNESVNGDLISKSALLKTLNEYVEKAYDCGGIDDENVIEYQKTHKDKSAYIIQGFSEVYELLEDVPTVYNDGWIPCSEKTPEFEIYAIKRMWVTMHKKGCGFHFSRQLRWNGCMGRWEWENGKTVSDGYEIVAWKPVDIPAPYQPKGE